jgi:predicted nucleic acid-binding protein
MNGSAEPLAHGLVDTGLLVDYLRGEPQAARALEAIERRAISVVTWVELMSLSPPGALEATRGFLRSFEQVPLSEPIADEACRLIRRHPGLALRRAVSWAAARVGRLTFVTTDPAFVSDDPRVRLAYPAN